MKKIIGFLFQIVAEGNKATPANISCFPRRLKDVFSVTLFVFQDVEDVFKTCLQDVLQLLLFIWTASERSKFQLSIEQFRVFRPESLE